MNQIARLLTLVPYLQQHPGASMTAVAESFGITPQQLRRDLGVLWMCGLPGLMPGDMIEIDMDAVDTLGVIHLTNAEYLSRPVRLSAAEALTLMVGLQSLQHVVGPEAADVVTSALAKVRAALGDRGRMADQVAVDIRSAAERVRRTMDDAVAGGYRVELEYQRADDLEPGRRSVDPHAVVLRDGYAYLEGWDCDRRGWRTFRLDRIVDAVVTSIPTGDHGTPPTTAGGSWLRTASDARPVEIWLAGEARWITESHPVEQLRAATVEDARGLGVEHDPDAVVVTLLVTRTEWLTRLLLRLGSSVRMLHPEAAAEQAAERAAAAMRMQPGASGKVEA